MLATPAGDNIQSPSKRLMPVFIDIMMDNPDADWGQPFYPVVD